jgi:hypothetical protein
MAEIRPHLKHLGSFGMRRTLRYARVKLQMGLRRRINVRVDDSRGVFRWVLTYKVLPDTRDRMIQLEPDDPLALYLNSIEPLSRGQYIFYFFQMVNSGEVSSFIITCLFDGKKYLVEFEDDELTYEMIATKLYTTGLNLVQVDQPDVATMTDGSLAEDTGNEQQI